MIWENTLRFRRAAVVGFKTPNQELSGGLTIKLDMLVSYRATSKNTVADTTEGDKAEEIIMAMVRPTVAKAMVKEAVCMAVDTV